MVFSKLLTTDLVIMAAGAGHGNFVFVPDFGQATISHFRPGVLLVMIDHAIFSSLDFLLFAATHDFHEKRGHHGCRTLHNHPLPPLLAHHGDFHLTSPTGAFFRSNELTWSSV